MIDQLIQQIIEEQHIPGIAIAIKQRGKEPREYYQGYANLEHTVPVTSETSFEIASVTKLFTAQAILILVQGGKVALNESIITYLPHLPSTWREVTVQHCLTHQSGIPSYTEGADYWATIQLHKSHEEILALVANKAHKFQPGTQHAYDNTAFYILGLIIEAVSKKSYELFLTEHIFTPLEMMNTHVNDYNKIIPHRAQGYIYQNGILTNKIFYSTTNTFSAGILLSTVNDLMKWQDSLFDDRILDEKLRKKWWTPHLSLANNEDQVGYSTGLGWFMIKQTPIGKFYGHNGGIPGFAASFLYFPDLEVSIALFCNAGHITEPHKIAIQILQQFYRE